MLVTYKNIVSKVYKLTQLSYTHQDTTEEFNDFLDCLQKAFEDKLNNWYVPPHIQITDVAPENVVVVKDDNVKNITIRYVENDDMNELITEEDVTEIDESLFVKDDEINDEKNDKEIASNVISTTLNESEQSDDAQSVDEDNEDDDLVIEEYMGVKYYISGESKRVYQFIDDVTHGPMIGKLENGKIVLI